MTVSPVPSTVETDITFPPTRRIQFNVFTAVCSDYKLQRAYSASEYRNWLKNPVRIFRARAGSF